MCAHFRIAQGVKNFLSLFDIAAEGVELPEEARPTDPVAAVLCDPETGQFKLDFPRWGLVPQWADDPKIATRMFNARAETLAERGAFKEAFRKRRCILPLASFYEFDEESRYVVTQRDCELMGVAGLWETRTVPGEPTLLTCTMVTTAPNEVIAKVHDRMPAILREEDYLVWMDPKIEDPSALLPMLVPIEPEKISMSFDAPRKSKKKSSGQQELF